jgi:hypothetical protein
MRKKSGGQPGNNNARKHGFYSRAFRPGELSRLDTEVEGKYEDEITLVRMEIDRISGLLHQKEALSTEDNLAWTRMLILQVRTLSNLLRNQKEQYAGQSTLEQALAELRKLDPDVD